MNNHDLLFIRACKALDPYKRVVSVYCRLYLMKRGDEGITQAVIYALTQITDKYCPMSPCDIIGKLNPDKHRFYNALIPEHDQAEYDYWNKVFQMVVNKIRHTRIDQFPGYVSSRKFK